MARREELTDEQWSLIEPLFDKPPAVATRGRPRCAEREVLNGILWILRSGARWFDLPDRFPPYQTCHRRFQQWVRDGRLLRVLETLAADLHTRGKLDLSDALLTEHSFRLKKGLSSGSDQAGQRYYGNGSGRPRWSFSRRLRGRVLRRTKSDLSDKLFASGSSTSDHGKESATKPTIRTRSMRSWRNSTLN